MEWWQILIAGTVREVEKKDKQWGCGGCLTFIFIAVIIIINMYRWGRRTMIFVWL